MRHLFIAAAILVAFVSTSFAQEVTTLRPLTTHVLTLYSTSEAMTQAVSSQTTWIRVNPTTSAFVAFGGSSVEATDTTGVDDSAAANCCYSSMRVPGGSVEYFRINRGEYIAVIRDVSDGEVFITEMTK